MQVEFHLYGEDDGLVHAEVLLSADLKRRRAGQGARGQVTLIVHVDERSFIRAVQHPVRESTQAVPEGGAITSLHALN